MIKIFNRFKKMLALALLCSVVAGDCSTVMAAPTDSAQESTEAATSPSGGVTDVEDLDKPEDVIKANWPDAPQLPSEIAILMDADTGAILYEKNAHQKAYPASTTKLMTGLLTVENCNLDEIVNTSYAAVSSITLEDSNIGAKVGEEFTVEQSLYALLVHSANETAYALAEHVGGDLPSFVMMMNMRAEELGALNTHFNNASGLHDQHHYTTAYDLAMIGRGCLNNATFVSFDSYSGYYRMPPTNKTSSTRTLIPRNEMLKGGKYYYEYCKGGKTGFTDEAMYTLVSFAEKNGVRLIAVVMRSGKNQRFLDCTSLFEYGFSNFTRHTPSESELSTLFGKTNYLSSNVFGKGMPAFQMSQTTLQLPTGVSYGEVKIKKDPNSTGILSSKINFIYNDGINDHIVGTANLTLDNVNPNDDLPYLKATDSEQVQPRFRPVVNVWLLIGIVLLLTLLYCGHNWLLNYIDTRKRKRWR